MNDDYHCLLAEKYTGLDIIKNMYLKVIKFELTYVFC